MQDVICLCVQVLLDRSMKSDAPGDPRKQRKEDHVDNPFEGNLSTVQLPSSKLPLEQQLQRLRLIRQDLEVRELSHH